MIAAFFAILLLIIACGIAPWLLIRKQENGTLKGDIPVEPGFGSGSLRAAPGALGIFPPDLGQGARLLARQNRSRERAALTSAGEEQVCETSYADPLKVLSVAQFDADCAILWDTQFPALHLVDAAGDAGLPARQLYPFYSSSVRLYPELFDNSTFRGWLQFLEQERLIKRIGKRVYMTGQGHEFLDFISSRMAKNLRADV